MQPSLRIPSEVTVLSKEQEARLRQYRRLWIAGEDLDETQSIVQEAIKAKLRRPRHNKPNGLLLAFTTSIVVSYARPFINSRGDSRTADRIVPERLVQVLTPTEREFHKVVLEVRNREVAHSDADILELTLELFPSGDGAISRVTREPLLGRDLRMLSRMITKLSEEIDRRCDVLRAALPHNVWL